MKDYSRPPVSRGRCVQQDWRACLPEEKAQVFHEHERHLESLYNMFSVSLNEAIELKLAGLRAKALCAISMSSQLCERLTRPLAGTLRVLHDHAKHYGAVPNAAPLGSACAAAAPPRDAANPANVATAPSPALRTLLEVMVALLRTGPRTRDRRTQI